MDSSYIITSNNIHKTNSLKFLNTNHSISNTKHKNNRILSLSEFKEKLLSQQTHNKKPNLKLQLNQDKPPLSSRKTLSTFRSDPVSTVSSFLPNSEREIHALSRMYYFTGKEFIKTSSNDQQLAKDLEISEKKEIFNKYNFKLNIRKSEKQDINNVLKSDTNRLSSLGQKNTTYIYGDIFFNSPYNSFQKLKLNQMIHDQVKSITKDLKVRAVVEKLKEVSNINKR